MRRIKRRSWKNGWQPTRKGGRCSGIRSFTPSYEITGSRNIIRSTQKTAGYTPQCQKNLPMFVPGWEDSTLGNMYAGHCISGDVKKVHTVRTGIEYMIKLGMVHPNLVDILDRFLSNRRRDRW